MDNKINAIGTCKGCGIEYDMDEVGRVYGYESSVYTIGYCSAICYTNSMTKKEDMDNKLLCTEGDWKVINTGSYLQVVQDLGEGESPEICRLFVKTMDLGKDAEANAHLIAASKSLYLGHQKHMEEGVKILNKWATSEKVTEKELRTFIGAMCENSASLLQKANPNYK
jgi:hypothetical protein